MTERPLYVPVTDVKTYFSVSRQTVYRAAARGEITIHKRAGRSLLNVSEVCAWIEGRDPSTDSPGGLAGGPSETAKA